MSAHLVLLGFGHAHIHVLFALAKARQKSADAANPNSVLDARITVVSPYASLVYSAMMPGWVAGHYNLADCEIPVQPLADAAKAQWVQSKVVSINRAKKTVALLDGQVLSYDFLSINTGAIVNADGILGAREHGILIRPLEQFIGQWESVCAQISSQTGAEKQAHIVVIGGGATGIEMALAARHHFLRPGFNVGVTLISGDMSLPITAQPFLVNALRREGVSVMHGRRVAMLAAGVARLEGGGEVVGDYFIVATGAAAAPYLRASGLDCDAQGFARTNEGMQALNDAAIFAVGDCATADDTPRQKSAVFAVSAGAPLATNLMRALQGITLKPYRPTLSARYLISTGAKHAIAVRGEFCFDGRWVWHWKNWIDRKYIAKYR
jgi:pyridine nucleotide-disulfide oxidoreductase family protein